MIFLDCLPVQHTPQQQYENTQNQGLWEYIFNFRNINFRSMCVKYGPCHSLWEQKVLRPQPADKIIVIDLNFFLSKLYFKIKWR